jgi:hypothetical protein
LQLSGIGILNDRVGLALQVIEQTHGFYNKLKSGERENTEELSLV